MTSASHHGPRLPPRRSVPIQQVQHPTLTAVELQCLPGCTGDAAICKDGRPLCLLLSPLICTARGVELRKWSHFSERSRAAGRPRLRTEQTMGVGGNGVDDDEMVMARVITSCAGELQQVGVGGKADSMLAA